MTTRSHDYLAPLPDPMPLSGRTAPAPVPVVYAPGYTLVGDVHGCLVELHALLEASGFTLVRGADDVVTDVLHPQDHRLGFVGDLAVKGPDSVGTLRLVRHLVATGRAVCVAGNNDAKLARGLLGGGARGATAQAVAACRAAMDPAEQRATADFLVGLPAHAVLRVAGRPEIGDCILVHAGLDPAQVGRGDGTARQRCIAGTLSPLHHDALGRPIRSHLWTTRFAGPRTPSVVYGHTEVTDVARQTKTYNLDTGCVSGGALTGMAWPAKTLTAIPAARAYYDGRLLTPAALFIELSTPALVAAPPLPMPAVPVVPRPRTVELPRRGAPHRTARAVGRAWYRQGPVLAGPLACHAYRTCQWSG